MCWPLNGNRLRLWDAGHVLDCTAQRTYELESSARTSSQAESSDEASARPFILLMGQDPNSELDVSIVSGLEVTVRLEVSADLRSGVISSLGLCANYSGTHLLFL
ncbi:MAG: uncharacterized protein KVP18_003306 [Porospora cf. gigantea A]|uniref:uncharacterized protein n=1 Tax=Porospora cf. gigantea A TaxID=2853593 RepID=UPI00355974A5|nr:MAG: hypothetical protein KVP18_003306 [Porospora cf. gigantea A]